MATLHPGLWTPEPTGAAERLLPAGVQGLPWGKPDDGDDGEGDFFQLPIYLEPGVQLPHINI